MKSKSSSNPNEKPADGAGAGAGTTDDSTLLGQILVQLGYLTIYQLDEALNIQREDKVAGNEHKPLWQILLEMGYCGPNQLIRAIQVQCEYRNAAAKK